MADSDDFKYTESLGWDVIRLVRIQDRARFAFSSRRIELDIKVFQLDHAPPYRALSYTWGPSHQGQPPYVDGDKRPIRIAGRRFLVLPNLWDALVQLRECFRRGGELSEGPRYLWIDALCINQDDLAERAAQVSVMDRVYSQATQTVVWLGKADHETSKARRLLEKITQIPPDESKAISATARGIRPDRPYFLARGLPDPTWTRSHRQRWLPIMDLFERAWFTRSWVVQEVLLSADILILCGAWSFSFFELVYTANFLHATSIFTHVNCLFRNPQSTTSTVLMDPTGRIMSLWEQWLMFHPERVEEEDPSGALKAMVRKSEGEILRFGQGKGGWSPARILVYFAYNLNISKCSDPRDKVFSLLGIVRAFMTLRGCAGEAADVGVVVDYRQQVTAAMVFQQAVEAMIRQTASLGVLALLRDSPDAKMKELPSWVPDFCLEEGTDKLSVMNPPFNAAGRSETQGSPFFAFADRRLAVSATLLCHVRTRSVSLVDFDQPHGTETWVGHLLSANTIYPFTQQRHAEIAGKVRPFTTQNRIEAFWRTLLADSVLTQGAVESPASWPGMRSGEQFFCYVLFLIMGSMNSHVMKLAGLKTRHFSSSLLASLEILARSGAVGELPQEKDFDDFRARIRRICSNPGGAAVRDDQEWFDRKQQACRVFLEEVLRSILGAAYVHGAMRGEAVSDGTRWERVVFV
ncbi:heterokaryon incompatibility protein-domain-containing protein [Podospora aff. communis PSN243]|uniref:Heterokaryon incompatibility protein-domain-containing protein n=1 Tax=Podospora aff. communis PSN243 TaxID=3040156 RepID=A0AAV9GBA7_9PEZI|nr:heterokaryon incompatibility protein-domain-containing protein [Podospora aff. communis PSN243]